MRFPLNLLREGNLRAIRLGAYMASIITALGIYNLFVKLYFDPCCRVHTVGETMLSVSRFLSYIAGGGILVLIVIIILKVFFGKFIPPKDISWRTKRESALNMIFVVVLIINFGLLLLAQLPNVVIGCTECKPEEINREVERYLKERPKTFFE